MYRLVPVGPSLSVVQRNDLCLQRGCDCPRVQPPCTVHRPVLPAVPRSPGPALALCFCYLHGLHPPRSLWCPLSLIRLLPHVNSESGGGDPGECGASSPGFQIPSTTPRPDPCVTPAARAPSSPSGAAPTRSSVNSPWQLAFHTSSNILVVHTQVFNPKH